MRFGQTGEIAAPCKRLYGTGDFRWDAVTIVRGFGQHSLQDFRQTRGNIAPELGDRRHGFIAVSRELAEEALVLRVAKG